MRERGLKGGRPRLPTINELSQSIAPEIKEGGCLPNSLKELKELFKLRQKSTVYKNIGEAVGLEV